MSLLLLFQGAQTGAAGVCTPAFQADAFQFSAFQLCTDTSRAVGWIGKLRHTRKDLEERLAKQRANTFSRRWFNEYLEAEAAALERAKEAKGKQRAALEEAVEAANEAVVEALDDGRSLEELTRSLNAAANATRVTASIRHAEEVIRLAALAEYDDDEETIELLLLH